MKTRTTDFISKEPTIPPQRIDTHPPSLAFPAEACDSHVHVFGPQQTYPHAAQPGYIPNEATPQQLRSMLDVIGCKRAVIVQPSYYGTDNSCTVAGLRAGNGHFRGVAAIDETITDTQLKELHEAGIRGIRVNLKAVNGAVSLALAHRLANRIKIFGWHIQFYFYADSMPNIADELVALPVEIVIDHIGYVRADDGIEGKGFQMLLQLAQSNRAWFKLSAPYRQSTQGPLFKDVAPLLRALYQFAPSKCVWGSDWPHASRNDTGIIQVPNDGDLADSLIFCFPDDADRQRILVHNPARLYGF